MKKENTLTEEDTLELETALDEFGYTEKQKQFIRRITEERAKLYSSPQLCLQRMKEHKIVLGYIPKEFWQDPGFCREAAQAWDQAIEYIPEEYRN